MKILSLQSSVAYGHVGNSAALFPLQRLGVEAWAVDCVQFSNHPGHGRFAGQVHAAEHVRAVVEGLDAIGALAQCDGLLTGYLGDAAHGDTALWARRRMPDGALFLCDPVMGDDGALYVRDAIPAVMRDRLVPAAGVVTPNRFELEVLAGPGDPVQAARRLVARGPELVVVTSVEAGDGIACLAVTRDAAWRVATPRLPLAVNGGGDTLSALLLAHLLAGRPAPEALALAVSGLFGVLARTRGRELALVEAQDELVRPTRMFTAERL